VTRAGPNPAENLYIELHVRGHVCHIVLNEHVPIKEMSDGSRIVSGYPISSLRNI
jgi:hypothetical protein